MPWGETEKLFISPTKSVRLDFSGQIRGGFGAWSGCVRGVVAAYSVRVWGVSRVFLGCGWDSFGRSKSSIFLRSWPQRRLPLLKLLSYAKHGCGEIKTRLWRKILEKYLQAGVGVSTREYM